MILHTRRWGPEKPESVVCVHGVTQHGGIFDELGQRLAARGHSVARRRPARSRRLRRLPPWNTDTHVADLVETLDALGVERVDLGRPQLRRPPGAPRRPPRARARARPGPARSRRSK